ncbi:DUF4105 domain-containing protein [Pararhizobium antarcticum]|uniref:Lnb N-terminal periplasmic domain-containing protein n=1 Tax=Pararhizobium antarcticum TaxID=1798805 RepID=A0A657LT88_9HYPH|nr:DUF4105 domain-containing protein [Pararhizobium antarcticum]OJF94359.1 hypothetical protein AX761_18715 [Rhizobium sp. 58]OJF96920.1 hypothetical protein AX760_03460 [Pararhizobium antarcticum]
MTVNTEIPPEPARRHVLGSILRWVSVLAIAGFAVWGAAALFYQAPGTLPLRIAAACAWVLLSLACLIVYIRRASRFAALVYPVAIAGLLFWWGAIAASNERDWADDIAQMTVGVVNGQTVTLANVRNFDWRTETDYTVNWETRTYDLEKLASVDMLLSYWSSPAIAHTLVSFGFEDGSFVTFSVEIRKEKHERFSEVGGFFKEFETSIVAADERDIVRLRTNVRKEDVYLYRIAMAKPAMRSLFMAYVDAANALAETPRFYNTVTANCTTIVYDMVARIVPDLPLDYRLIFSGYLAEYIDTVRGLTPGFTLEQLRMAGRIGPRAVEADNTPDFSARIREGIPPLPL